MPVYKQYKYDHRGWLEAVEETYSDKEIDLKNYLPPVRQDVRRAARL